MLMATGGFSAAASFSHVSAIRSAVARLMVLKSWICSASLPLTTNCDGTFCADTEVPSAMAAAAKAIAVMRTFMSTSPACRGIVPRTASRRKRELVIAPR